MKFCRDIKNPEDAKHVVEAIEHVVDDKVTSQTGVFTQLINKDIENLRQDMHRTFATKNEIQQIKVDLIKWVFAFFVTIALLIIGVYLKL